MSKKAFLITKLPKKSNKEESIMASKGQKFQKYDEALKTEVIKAKVELGYGYAYPSQKYGIPKGTINTWVYQYRQGANKITRKKRGRPKKEENIDYKERYEILKKYQEYLKGVEQEKR